MCGDTALEGTQVVTAFEEADDATVAEVVGDLAELVGHFAEHGRGELDVGDGVFDGGVEASADQ